ncbi:hypothetical protein SAMN05421510_101935 [Nitrosomonas ureae]|uniref:Uncharacterized protein n=1 Tax=Nitrosomonas ureae TaxID=44577 RepID=A0A1H9D534_9PROT|nr:hypothetical protein SAMN05421510_101935 [Nitrosomonas ureae]
MTIQTGMSWLTLLATPTSPPFRYAISYPSSPSFLRDVSRNPQYSNSSSTWFFSRNLSTNNGFSLRACGNDAMRVPHSPVRIYTSSPIRHAVSSPPSFLHDSSRNPQHSNSTSTRLFGPNLSASNGFPLRACGNDGTGVPTVMFVYTRHHPFAMPSHPHRHSCVIQAGIHNIRIHHQRDLLTGISAPVMDSR